MSLLPANFMSATWGANFVGTLLSCVSYGVLVAVAWTYFSRFMHDRWAFKALAVFMLVIGTADTAINCNYTYTALIKHFGVELWILYTNWNFLANILFIGAAGVVLQGFMSYRIWVVSERRWRVWPACSILLSLAAFGVAIWLSQWYEKQELTTALATKSTLVWCWFGFATLSELMSTLALNWFLVLKPRKASSGVVLPGRGVFLRLALRAVETNLLSLAVHVAIVILYAKRETLFYWYSAPAFMIVKVYGVSLLVTLLSRGSAAHSLSRWGSSPDATPRLDWHSAQLAGGTMTPPSRILAPGQGRSHLHSAGVAFELETHVHVDRARSGSGLGVRALALDVEDVRAPAYVPRFSFGPGPELFPPGSSAASAAEVEEGRRHGTRGDREGREVVEARRLTSESDKEKANMGWI